MGRVLVVDDEQSLRDVLEVLVTSRGHTVTTASGVSEAQSALQKEEFDLVITDLRLEPGGDGMDVVTSARSRTDAPEVIVMTAYGDRQKALQAHEMGAAFYLEKGPHLATDLSVLVAQAIDKRTLAYENVRLREELRERNSLEGIIGRSAAMKEVFTLVERIAPTKANVLITGESGVGKERIARGLHYRSSVSGGPFVPLNCGAIPSNLIESELFGHVKGAYTGADSASPGLFVAAHDGTIFLDEIAELPLILQPKLLRVLQERRVMPVGSTNEVEVNARVVAATNRDIEAEVKAGRFREDLYFRLNVVQILVPPLRQRAEDVPLLVRSFLEKYAREYNRDLRSVSPGAMAQLLSYRWPGNVRELENVVERAVALAMGTSLTESQLPPLIREQAQNAEVPRLTALDASRSFPEGGIDLDRTVDDFEFGLVAQALERAGGVKSRAADLLGLSARQLRYKLSKYEDRLALLESHK